MKKWIIFYFLLTSAIQASANDGYKLWLQYYSIPDDSESRSHFGSIHVSGNSPTIEAIKQELDLAANGFFGTQAIMKEADEASIIIKKHDKEIANVISKKDINSIGDQGFVIKTIKSGSQTKIYITANSDLGLLYGTFKWLQYVQKGDMLPEDGLVQSPKIERRILNHWDNLDRTVERGYSGFSIWNWHRLPRHIDQQYLDYARANAAIGINGTVVTNVNANSLVLTEEYLEKVAALADVFRPYGIKTYLTARFSSPIEIGKLNTADPLDPDVQKWWADKAEEIYRHIPDFGGFLVKADSEGQPGPHNYKRSQAEGANLLADALKPHGGIVMWRAFVYSEESPDDRAKQAYNEFKPLDGKFRDNVIVQVKNGAIDFQPREPFHPMFGGLTQTPLMMEFQITQEYLGHDTHMAFLSNMYEEVLQTDTHAKGEGSTVSKIISGNLHDHDLTAIAGVANIGTDRNWTGNHFHQANWYSYGRLAWDPDESSDIIAKDWLELTFTRDETFVSKIQKMMLDSHQMVVNYMTPLGLHHIMAWNHHYGPGPWITDKHRDDWTSTYYHQASSYGIGFDRTASGSNALSQYHPHLSEKWSDKSSVPEKYLLWFHHVAWDHTLSSGRILWDELALRYQKGVNEARNNIETWQEMEGKIDQERFKHIASFLKIQAEEAEWWKNACLLYFQQFSQKPFPDGVEEPERDLNYYKNIDPKFVPGI
ncbi:alpha-glucuronidase family glycosyl hydrolase [Anditalea andensis]|uniref:Xylan alpha-1,2-glucuronidase n=1 Tax=Anditalea andensis TaxID=1048983 RepID=A0A074L7D8_9BACT|nr:alpha-glucuronidase family glycosyl hydrolase [Anditalea andensis]KEO75768.1 alpha-glucuronidase [Anditalea andensis]